MSKTPLINSAMKAKTAQPLLEKTSAKLARGKVIWLLLKYQIVTKTLLYIALVPGFTALVRLLILSTGRTAITSGDYWPFLLSAQGAGMLLLAILLLMVTVGLDINAFVVMTALIYEGKTELTVRRMLLVGLKSLKLLIRPSGLVIVFYVSLVLPLLGLGIFITPTQGLQIPNFVTEVIYDSPLYLGLYATVLIGLLILGLRHIFALHYMMILGQDTLTAFRSSAQLLKGRKWQFFKDFVGWDLDEKISLINAPTKDKPYGNAYTVKFLGTVKEAEPIHYINVPIEVLKKAAIDSIKAGQPVWFGCDMGPYISRKDGIMDMDIYTYKQTIGELPTFTKEERLDYGDSLLTHAMVLTGVDLDSKGNPIKWQVENSWGDEVGQKGIFSMSDEWFDEYTYQIMVEKKFVEKKWLDALNKPLVELEPWDPMGALALMK